MRPVGDICATLHQLTTLFGPPAMDPCYAEEWTVQFFDAGQVANIFRLSDHCCDPLPPIAPITAPHAQYLWGVSGLDPIVMLHLSDALVQVSSPATERLYL